MFQVNETRSRQKLVVANMLAARSTSRVTSARSKSANQASMRVAAGSAVGAGRSRV